MPEKDFGENLTPQIAPGKAFFIEIACCEQSPQLLRCDNDNYCTIKEGRANWVDHNEKLAILQHENYSVTPRVLEQQLIP